MFFPVAIIPVCMVDVHLHHITYVTVTLVGRGPHVIVTAGVTIIVRVIWVSAHVTSVCTTPSEITVSSV